MINKQKFSKKEKIITTALGLFKSAHDVKKVSLETIAREARVSPTTIYNYFGSREQLLYEIIKVLVLENIAHNKDIVVSNLPFPQKLMGIMGGKMDIARQLNGEIINKLVNQDRQLAPFVDEIYENEIKPLWHILVSDGKKQGYIDKSLNEDALALYLDVIKTGFSARPELVNGFKNNLQLIMEMTNLMFYGFLQKKIDLFAKGAE